MPGIREFDKYIKEKLQPSLQSAHIDFEILSEADLQSLIWAEITKYLRRFPISSYTGSQTSFIARMFAFILI